LKKRAFGATGIEVSELVFGGGAVGGLLINQDDDTRRTAISRALQAGINWIDTAPSYGQGRSEEALGWLLEEIDADPYVSTKFSIDTRELADISGQIESSLVASLQRLKRDSVTLLQLHNRIGAHTDGRTIGATELLRAGGVLDALQGLQDQGLIRHFGITALGEPDSIIEVISSGRIASAQVYHNLLNPSAAMSVPATWPVYDFGRILDACESHQVAAMNIRVFSAGVIVTDSRTGREQPLTPGDTVESEQRKAKAVFDSIGSDYGSRSQTAIRFALAEKKLACVIIGLAELAHLDEAVKAQEMGALPQDGLQRIRSVYARGIPGGDAEHD
jgi:aryl-alcohol dehydrogenase-like predicted oxidoreductase|tara:strand:- start:1411 stop:2406 length:996 start_codon:yes stop_codon:yes gene_type:complete